MSSTGLTFEAFFQPLFPIEQSLPLAKAAIQTLVEAGYGPMSPFSERMEAMLAAERDERYESKLSQLWLNVERFEQSGDRWWTVSLMQLHLPDEGWANIIISFPSAQTMEEYRRNLSLLLEAAPRLVEVLQPRIALIIPVAGLGLKHLTVFRREELPPVLAPWTFLAAGDWAPEKHDALLQIPGARLTPASGGVVFEVPDFLERPRRELERAVKALPRTPRIKWCPPTPPAEDS